MPLCGRRRWVAGAGRAVPDNAEEAAARLYDLALTFQERSQHVRGRLLEQIRGRRRRPRGLLGDLIILDDEDERLPLKSNGHFEAEVVPEREEDRGHLAATRGQPEDMVQFYDPTDVFGDLAETLAEAYPSVAPELGDDGEGDGTSPA